MLEELDIDGFRCFARFHIGGLRRINLISGKNSAGKSSLLEAVQFFMQPNLGSLQELLDWRGQLVSNRQIPAWTEETVGPLFHRSLPSGEREFRIRSTRREVRCREAFHRLDASGDCVVADGPVNGGPRKPVLRVEADQTNRYFFVASMARSNSMPLREAPFVHRKRFRGTPGWIASE